MSEKKPVNLYEILDNEMARMHQLLLAYLALPKEDGYSHSSYGGLNSGSAFNSTHANVIPIYKRIMEMQDLMLKALVAHDEIIQEKVAELALTGENDEAKV